MSVKTTKIIFSLLIVVAVILPPVLLGSGFFASASGRVLAGIEVMGTDLGGQDRAEGLATLAKLEKDLRATKVALRYQEKSWPLLLSEAGLELNEEAVMEAALKVNRMSTLFRPRQERKPLEAAGLTPDTILKLNREELTRRVEEMTKEITAKPRDASFKIHSNDTVTVIPAKNGVSVDIDKLEKDIISTLADGKEPQVYLSLVNVPPSLSTESVAAMGIKGLLAGYTTRFDPAKVSRTYNISVAAKALDELLVGPGEEVSFNKVVGPRSSEAGYKNAPVIVNNEFVDGLGGGVCQVSTTLYNSVLLAGLEIVDRSNHSLPVSYVPIGRDATVVYDAIDFKFRNNTGNHLFFKSFINGGRITFKIYGNTDYKKDVSVNTWITQEIEPQVIYETDPNLPKGEQIVKQEGSKGFKVSAERVFRSNGSVKKREALPSSYYSPVNRIIAVGSMEKTKPQIVPPATVPPAVPPASRHMPPMDNREWENHI